MHKFVTKGIEAVKGKQQFKQLVILPVTADAEKLQREIDAQEEKNETPKFEDSNTIEGVLDVYEKSLEDKYKSSFAGILTYMNLVANLQKVPEKKFKDVTPDKEDVKEYEFKNGKLRVYLIGIPNGKLIIHCGYKNEQPEDFVKFRSLKKQYLEGKVPKKVQHEKRRIDTK